MSEDVSVWNDDLLSITLEMVRLVTGGWGAWYILLFVQELEFDLGSGFTGEGRMLYVYDQ